MKSDYALSKSALYGRIEAVTDQKVRKISLKMIESKNPKLQGEFLQRKGRYKQMKEEIRNEIIQLVREIEDIWVLGIILRSVKSLKEED